MYPVKDSFHIVLVGGWNPSIFNQEWINANISEDADTEIIVAFPLDDATAPRKISFEGLNIYPGRKQLVLSPESADSNGIRLCADKLSKILELLVHTPVGNCGVNFQFEESNNLVRLLEVFSNNDQANIDGNTYSLISSSVTRKFQVHDELEMNLSIMESPNGVIIAFNFHHETNDIESVRGLITPDYVESLYNQAITFCSDVYGLEIEEGISDE